MALDRGGASGASYNPKPITQTIYNNPSYIANSKVTTPTTTKTPSTPSAKTKVETGSDIKGTFSTQGYTDYATKNYGANSNVTTSYAKANNTTINPQLDPNYKEPTSYVPQFNDYSQKDYGPQISSEDFLDYYKSLSDDALDDVINSIMARLNVSRGQYDALRKDVNANFDDEIAQSEVQRYRGKRALRNSLSNRGALDSGLGRYEMLFNDAQAQNRISSINTNRQKALNDIEIALQQAEAQANSDIASARNSVNSQLLQYALNNL